MTVDPFTGKVAVAFKVKRWIHQCPWQGKMTGHCGYDDGGEVWHPNDTARHMAKLTPIDTPSDYQVARAMMLTGDPEPDPNRPYVMVAWNCRPGALQVHYIDELEFE